jgi:hypothetical protein
MEQLSCIVELQKNGWNALSSHSNSNQTNGIEEYKLGFKKNQGYGY